MRNYIVFLVCFVLIGCDTVLKNTDDFANAAIANDQIQSGQVGIVIKSAPLSDTERMIVDHALNEYMAFVERWKGKLQTLDSTSTAFTIFLVEYESLVSQYKSTKRIVENHWAEYTPINQTLLTDYHARANKINASVDGLITAGHRYQALLDAITLAKILAGVAVKI